MGGTQVHCRGDRKDEMVWRQGFRRQVFEETVKGFGIIGIGGAAKKGL